MKWKEIREARKANKATKKHYKSVDKKKNLDDYRKKRYYKNLDRQQRAESMERTSARISTTVLLLILVILSAALINLNFVKYSDHRLNIENYNSSYVEFYDNTLLIKQPVEDYSTELELDASGLLASEDYYLMFTTVNDFSGSITFDIKYKDNKPNTVILLDSNKSISQFYSFENSAIDSVLFSLDNFTSTEPFKLKLLTNRTTSNNELSNGFVLVDAWESTVGRVIGVAENISGWFNTIFSSGVIQRVVDGIFWFIDKVFYFFGFEWWPF